MIQTIYCIQYYNYDDFGNLIPSGITGTLYTDDNEAQKQADRFNRVIHETEAYVEEKDLVDTFEEMKKIRG